MGIKRYYICCFSLLLLTTVAHTSFSQVRKLDRKKWDELRKEIDKRRYDKREVISSYDRDRENRTYQDIEDANEWADKEERNQNPNRASDYSEHDKPDGTGGSGGYSEGDGDGEGNLGESNGESDSDIFDDNSGKGTDADDELGNSTWNDDESGNGNGGSRPDDENTYRTNPPERDRPTRSRSYSNSSSGGISSVWMYIILGVLVAFILYLIFKSVDWNNKKVQVVQMQSNDRFENLEFTKSELELAIEKALREGNYREAVRIYFLAVIKELRDHNLIRWEKKKTNYSYLNEMMSHPKYRNFEFATRVFEVVWYGNRTIGSEEFQSVEPVYKDLLHHIGRV